MFCSHTSPKNIQMLEEEALEIKVEIGQGRFSRD
jgi:hypothetical protein